MDKKDVVNSIVLLVSGSCSLYYFFMFLNGGGMEDGLKATFMVMVAIGSNLSLEIRRQNE